MAFDVISYAMGLQRGKASGGSGGSSDTVIFEKQTVEGFEGDGSIGITAVIYDGNAPFVLVDGKTYRVIWDDEEFVCKAVSVVVDGDTGICLGNTEAMGGIAGNEPFGMVSVDEGNFLMIIAHSMEASHSLAVYQKAESNAGGETKEIEVKSLEVTATGRQMTVVHNWGKVPDIIFLIKTGNLAIPGCIQDGIFFSKAMCEKSEEFESRGHLRMGTEDNPLESTLFMTDTNGIDGSDWTIPYTMYGGIREATETQFVVGGSDGGLTKDTVYEFIAVLGLT